MKPKTILFWSGGKDSLLALQNLQQGSQELVLFTTYDEEETIVPYQGIPLRNIYQQAGALKLPLITTPLPHPCPNELYLERVHYQLQQIPFKTEKLAFGDWFLEDIRNWRTEEFGKIGFECEFPIWKKPVKLLLDQLFDLNVTVSISNVDEQFRDIIQVGQDYDHHFIHSLPDSIDPMGENGEFHTYVHFKD